MLDGSAARSRDRNVCARSTLRRSTRRRCADAPRDHSRPRDRAGRRQVDNALIVVTVAPDRSIAQTRTDSLGAYALRVENGAGDYLVHITKIGLVPFRKRVTRSGNDSVFVVDASLAEVAQRVAPVRVEAQKPKPIRNADPGTGAGAAEKLADVIVGALAPDQIGDIASTASTIPGVTSTAGGYSVLGLDASQNSATLNGMSFPGASFPRMAPVNSRLSVTTYDPSRGWFSGATTNLEMASGSIYSFHRASATIDAPALQYTDPVSARLGQRFTNVTASVGGSGPIDSFDKYFYSYGAQAGRRTADARSLLDADADLLGHAGVAADSVTKFLNELHTAGIPATIAGIPSSLTTDNAQIIMRLDRAPFDWKALAASKTTEALTVYGFWSRARPVSLSPTATPARSGETTQGALSVQALYSTFIGGDYLTTTRSAVSLNATDAAPFVDLPGASVLVGSTFADGTDAFSTLQFGGAGGGAARSRQWTWETTHETQFYSLQRKSLHRVKLSGDVRLDGFDNDLSANTRGTFVFNSLADLDANRPASFSRTLVAPERTGAEWNAYAALGDLWRVSPALQLQYGARLEGNRFVQVPAYDAQLEQTLNVRNDVVPNRMHVSPRVGFTWIRGGAANNGAITFNPMGQFNMGPTSYIRGGIGELRNMIAPSLLSDVRANTGLPGSSAAIACVGAAAPAPHWASYLDDPSSVPATCANASGSGVLAESAPNVRVIDPRYDAPRSWRGNLSYASQFKRLTYSVEGVYSLNLNQPSITDLNLARTTAFVSGSDGRAMFVPASAIDAQTGAVSSAASRIAPTFGQVLASASDSRSVAKQLIVTASPDLFRVSDWWTSLSYVLASTRSLENGFTGTTFDSPFTREWSRGALDARHTFVVRAGYSAHGLTAVLDARVASGFPFTPVVGGDVNGDGLAYDDRARVFDPARVSDPSLAAGLRSLIASSDARTRDCLEQQLGQVAGRRSCEAPWSTSMTAAITAASQVLHLKRVVQVQLFVTNPLAGADLLLHGADRLRGWGVLPVPDPVLYNVRGFDPASRTFLYSVNPRFGNTNPVLNTLRAPFRVTLDATFALGTDPAIQQLERYLRPGRSGHDGPRLAVDELERRYERSVGDPYSGILTESDSLLLAPEQVRAVQEVQARYRRRMDALWLSLATELAALGDTYDVAAEVKRQEDAIDNGFEISRQDVRENLPGILTPIQLAILPGYALRLYQAKEPARGSGRTLYP